MTERVDSLLTAEHGFDRDLLAEIDSDDLDYAEAIATHRTDGAEPLRALELLATADRRRGTQASLGILTDSSYSDVERAGAARVAGKFAAGEDVESLLSGAVASEDSMIQTAALQAAMRLATGSSISTMQDSIASMREVSAEQASFAMSVAAYRAGVSGYELPVPQDGALLAAPEESDRNAIEVSDVDQAALSIVAGLAPNELFGVTLDINMSRSLVCAGVSFVLALDYNVVSELPARITSEPHLVGLLAQQDPVDDNWSVAGLLFSWPDGQGGAHLALHRTDGFQQLYGHAELGAESTVGSWIAAVAAPGAVPVLANVQYRDGSFSFDGAWSGDRVADDSRAARQHPAGDPFEG
jgi:hypothetical protein